uniref:ARAD1D16830p n=1 Tax=Blastobotrys adeninivorans TaxID=409370 RepID=A0A060TFS0_BLAAD
MMASMVPSQAVLVPPKASGPAAYFRLTQDAVDAILNANGQGVSMIVDSKNQMKLKVGAKLFSTSSIAEACPIDLYNVSPAPKLSSSSKPASAPHLYGLGNVTTRVSVVQSSTGESTLASKLKSQSKTLREEKEANKAQLLSGAPSTLAAGRSSRRTSPSARPTSALGVALASSANNHYHPRSVPGSPLINSPSSANSPSGSSASTSSHSSRPRTLQLGSSKPLVTQPLQSGPNRVVHLLALGPNTVQGLSQRTNLALTEVEAIVAEYATRKPDGTFVLADNRYRELRIWEWKPYSNSERSKVIQDARAAFDRLGYPADSSARRMLVDPKIRKERAESEKIEKDSAGDRTAESSPSVSPQKDPKQQQPKPNALKRVGALLKVSNPPAKKAKTASRSSSASEDDRQHTPTPRESTPRTASPMPASPKSKTGSASTPASKNAKAVSSSSSKSSPAPSTKASTTSTSTASTSAPGKAKSAPKANGAGRPSSAASGKVDDDLFELARKFRQTYSEYEKLYAQVSSAERKKSRADVQKLLSMHRELESWKRKLWTVNPSNKV